MTGGADNPNGTATDLEYVADRADFDDTDRIVTEVSGREIAVFQLDGTFHALANYCVHQGGPVCEGMVSGTLTVDGERALDYESENLVVACPWHGWEFDIETGNHLARPKYRLPTYDVVVRDGRVYLDL